MSDRNCLGCVHCHYSSYQRGYSEMTPSSPASMDCHKDRWPRDGYRRADPTMAETKREMSDVLDTAKTCDEYSPEEWVKS